ncbi:hypothetical protein BC832DRAFT_590158 [Gaertneriomyces semiglobifer]|nr:hypothetical protein BC832DRAFT_590158 [Gaertneriomyces semiglobifer]
MPSKNILHRVPRSPGQPAQPNSPPPTGGAYSSFGNQEGREVSPDTPLSHPLLYNNKGKWMGTVSGVNLPETQTQTLPVLKIEDNESQFGIEPSASDLPPPGLYGSLEAIRSSLVPPDETRSRESASHSTLSSVEFESPSPPKRKVGRKPIMEEPTDKRIAQNRAAQRAYRERKERHVRTLEKRVKELEAIVAQQPEAELQDLRLRCTKGDALITDLKVENALLREKLDRANNDILQLRKYLHAAHASAQRLTPQFTMYEFSNNQRAGLFPPQQPYDYGAISSPGPGDNAPAMTTPSPSRPTVFEPGNMYPTQSRSPDLHQRSAYGTDIPAQPVGFSTIQPPTQSQALQYSDAPGRLPSYQIIDEVAAAAEGDTAS